MDFDFSHGVMLLSFCARPCGRTVDVDTYQALTVCILARDVCKSPFQIMGRQNRTPATIRRREYRISSALDQ
jgi:hypothetical protein